MHLISFFCLVILRIRSFLHVILHGNPLSLSVESEQKALMRAFSVQEVLVEERAALSDLLQQLMKQRSQREQELQQVLVRTALLLSGET